TRLSQKAYEQHCSKGHQGLPREREPQHYLPYIATRGRVCQFHQPLRLTRWPVSRLHHLTLYLSRLDHHVEWWSVRVRREREVL
ncbi:hypothetical protein KIPB_007923, partial [Kipferlia bialata]